MRNLKEFYQSSNIRAFPDMVNTFSKPRFRQPLDGKEREILRKYLKQVYNPKLKKLEENQDFAEEWIEPMGQYLK